MAKQKDLAPSKSPEKKPRPKSRKRRMPVFSKVTWPEVVRALSGTPWLHKLTKGLRRRGCSHSEFEHSRRARRIVCNSLTTVEDRNDDKLRHARTTKLNEFMCTLRDIRRRLEWELWP